MFQVEMSMFQLTIFQGNLVLSIRKLYISASSLNNNFSFFVMVVGGLFLVYITLKLEQYSPSLQIPLGLVYTIIPVSGILIIFYKISNIEF